MPPPMPPMLAKYRLEPGYLFYPAQFWPHKNHITLLAALALLRERGITERLVLCGSDRSGRDKIDAGDPHLWIVRPDLASSASSTPPSSARSIAAHRRW